MSNSGQQQGEKDARDGRGAANMQTAHWKVEQDYNAAYAREREKENNKK